MRNMKDSGIEWIGEVPEDWEVVKISNIYKEVNEKVSDKDYAPLSVTKKGIVPQLENVAKTDNGDNRKLVKKGDFVINSRSDRRGSCGISTYDGSVSLICTVLKPFDNIINSYYNYLFKSELFADEFYKYGHGIVDDLWSTKWNDMKRIYIPFPTLIEQQKIANYLDSKVSQIDNIISKTKETIEEYRKYKQSVITEAVTKGLNPNVEMKDSGIEWIGEIPRDKNLIRNKYAIQYIKGKNPMELNNSKIGLPYIGASDLSKEMNFEEYENYTLEELPACDYDDILILWDGARAGLTGRHHKGIISSTIVKLEIDETCILKRFYYWYIRGLEKYINNMVNGTTIPHMNRKFIENIAMINFSLEEQELIADYLDSKVSKIDNLISKKEQLISELEQYKKSLIYECVTGKREVK